MEFYNSAFTPSSFATDNEIPTDILDDLCSRFIINVPEEERKDLIRLCFQVEQAHWFYMDFYLTNNTKDLKYCGIREFAYQIFKHIPYLQPYLNNVEGIIDEWKGYKLSVPTFGAILLDENMSHVLLVQSYYSKSSWGFPKGKINKDEPPYQCAIREVYEETGFNIENLINPKEFIEAQVNEQIVRLYVVPGVSRGEIFEPKTRNEIKAVNWFLVTELPATRKDATVKLKTGLGAHSFFMVIPFVKRLRQWIFDQDKKVIKKLQRPRYKSCGDLDSYQCRDAPSPNRAVKVLHEKSRDQLNRSTTNGKENDKESNRLLHNASCPAVDRNLNASFSAQMVPPLTKLEEPSSLSLDSIESAKPIPFNAISLTDSFLKNGIPTFMNFKFNSKLLFSK